MFTPWGYCASQISRIDGTNVRVYGSVTLPHDGGMALTSSSECMCACMSYVLPTIRERHRNRKKYAREISHLVVQQMCCRGITEWAQTPNYFTVCLCRNRARLMELQKEVKLRDVELSQLQSWTSVVILRLPHKSWYLKRYRIIMQMTKSDMKLFSFWFQW